MSWKDVLDAATQAALITAQILIIVATAASSPRSNITTWRNS
jgi:hypothetical protein